MFALVIVTSAKIFILTGATKQDRTTESCSNVSHYCTEMTMLQGNVIFGIALGETLDMDPSRFFYMTVDMPLKLKQQENIFYVCTVYVLP